MKRSLQRLVRPWPIRRLERAGELFEVEDRLVVEEPLEIVVGGEVLAVIMRTPGHDGELARGLLYAEGVITEAGDVLEESSEAHRLELTLTPAAMARRERARRTMFATSACGICGKTAIGEVVGRFPPPAAASPFPAELLHALPAALRRSQPAFRETGGLHAAALFDRAGSLRLIREDVGRHSALDKVLGAALAADWLPATDGIVLVSGRAGYELVAKTVALGAPLMAAVSAPSSLAVDLARAAAITLVGFLRADRLNIYTHPERIEQERRA